MDRRQAGAGRTAVVATLAVVLVGVAIGVLVARDGGRSDGDDGGTRDQREQAALAAATRFAEALSQGRPGEAGTVEPPEEVELLYAAAVMGLGAVALEVTPGPVVVTPAEDEDEDRDGGAGGGDGGPPSGPDDAAPDGELPAGGAGPVTATAVVPLSVAWTVSETTWTSGGDLVLEERDARWRSRWSISALDDRLHPGDALSAERTTPDRAPLLDREGTPLVTPTEVVVVGVQPRRTTDVDGLVAELERLLGIDPGPLAVRIRAAAPDAFVEVITLRRRDYEPLRPQLHPLPGTVFRDSSQLLAPTRAFARALLGAVGPATEEQAAASAGRLAPGDLTGQSGLQARYDEQLRGRPGLEVRVTRGALDDPPGPTEPLETMPATPGRPVRTTLDVATQTAADAALAGEDRVSALVAVQASTGQVLALANGPAGTTSNIGATGRVPPGSTFKVVTTLAHLRRGLAVDQVVPCPRTARAGGRDFGNAGGFALGDVPFRTSFARSCNTAFVGLSADLGPDDLAAAGRAFGLGVEVDAGIASYAGSVPPTEGAVDAAAASIGQGRLQVSPLALAGVAATVASGTWRPPRVVTDPAPASAADQPLGPGEAETLRELMRGVVTGGTGQALAAVPGGEVFAKTGTAEFGTEDPPRTHAWVIGFQGDVAFAVFVEGGESGAGTAIPLAAAFLTARAGD